MAAENLRRTRRKELSVAQISHEAGSICENLWMTAPGQVNSSRRLREIIAPACFMPPIGRRRSQPYHCYLRVVSIGGIRVRLRGDGTFGAAVRNHIHEGAQP